MNDQKDILAALLRLKMRFATVGLDENFSWCRHALVLADLRLWNRAELDLVPATSGLGFAVPRSARFCRGRGSGGFEDVGPVRAAKSAAFGADQPRSRPSVSWCRGVTHR